MNIMSRILRFLRNKDFVILLVIFVIGFILRTYNLHEHFIFAYDQGRDAQRIFDLVHNSDIKLVGPETDIQGIFNGPLFYYLLAIVSFLTKFNVVGNVYFMTIVNLSGLFLVYYWAKLLFNNKVGLLAALFWSLSYEQANYARYLSNASFMSIATLIFFIGLTLFLFRKKNIGLYVSVIGLGLAMQFNIYLGFLIAFYPLCYFVFKPIVSAKTRISTFILIGIVLLPFLLVELKFNFASIQALIQYMDKQSNMVNIVENISVYLLRLSETTYYSVFSFNNFLSLLLLCFFLWYNMKVTKKRQELIFLYMCVFSTLPLFAFHSGVLTVPVINSTITGPLALLFGLSFYNLLAGGMSGIFIAGIFVIVLSNLNLYVKDNFTNVRLLLKNPLLYSDEKEVIDFIYKSSEKKPFSVCAMTNPLFINTLWSYLFMTYGKSTYGTVPFWSGQKQYVTNYRGLPYDTTHLNNRYLILEPPIGLPDHALKTTIYLEDKQSLIDEERKYNEIRVQKRHLLGKNEKSKDSQQLTQPEILSIEDVVAIDPRYSCFNSYE